MKKIKNILSYPAIFDPINEGVFKGGFTVSFPDFPGCVTFGSSFEETQKMAEEVLSLWIENMLENGDKIPERIKSPILQNIITKISIPA